jgi:hypothetical protein
MMLTNFVTNAMNIISPTMDIILTNCTMALSMATNLLATLLIAYKLWLVNISFDVDDYCLFPIGSTEKAPAILV